MTTSLIGVIHIIVRTLCVERIPLMIILYQIPAVSRATIICLCDCNNVPPLLVPLSSVLSVLSSFCNQLFVLSSFKNKYNTMR